MRILHVLLYTPFGGVETSTRDLFVALEARGHENVLVYDGSTLPGLEREGRRVYRLPGLLDPDPSRGRQLARRAEEILDEAECDLAYLHTTMNVVLAERILSRLPTVYFAHNYAAFCPSGGLFHERRGSVCELQGVPNWRCPANAYLQRCNTRRPARLWRSYQRAVRAREWVRRADAIICDSEYVLHRHLENGFPRERAYRLPPATPVPPRQASTHSPREPLILFVGRVTPQKGLEYLIRALPKIEAPCTLVVAGDGYQLPALRKLAASLGVADRMSFRGALDRAAVHELYARAAVLAVPSVWPEPYGLVGPEAMSYGVPVVGFRVGGIPDWLVDGETGFLVDPRDANGLARSIETLLRDPALAQRFGARGREVAEERFTLHRHVDELLQVFRAAVDRRRAVSTAGPVSPRSENMECANKGTGLKISVIIATYRRPAALKVAVESLRQQTRPPDEVVVAAWAGDAPSLSVVEELARDAATGPASLAVTPVITTENTVAAKENAGIQAVRGNIVCFMDDDAVARPDWLQRIERHYGDPTVGAVGGRDVVWLDGQVLERQVREVGRVHWFGRLTGNHHNRAAGIRAVDFLKGCNMSFRRGLLSRIDRRIIGPIPYGFEIDMGLAVRAQGHRVVYDPEALVDHYPSTNYAADRAVLSRVVNHNQTYILLKRLPWTRKLVFLLYTFLIGDQNTIGLLRLPWLAWRQRWSSAVVRAHFAGKVAGIRSYVGALRERHDT